jgi:hypothetical protein
MSKRITTGSLQKEKSKSERLGIGSYESPRGDSYSRQNLRAEFFRVVDILEPDLSITLYKKAYFQYILLVWRQFPEAVPPAVSALLKDRSFLSELERVVKDFSASPYNYETSSFHPAFVELLAAPFRKDQQMVVNHLRTVLMVELLRPFTLDDGLNSFKMASSSWSRLQRVKNSIRLRKIIVEWSKYWNIDADWCRDFAVVALWEWLSDKSSRWDEHYISFRSAIAEIRMKNIWTAHIDPVLALDGDVDDFQTFIDKTSWATQFRFAWRGIDFQTSRWNPLGRYRDEWARESEQEFIAYLTRRLESGDIVPTGALRKFRAARDAYLREIERVAPLAGLIKTPRRWAREHLVWAARFQVQKWPLSKIEETYSKPRKTIADGINRTLDFIGLARRPNLRSGMPKGTRLSAKRRIVRN